MGGRPKHVDIFYDLIQKINHPKKDFYYQPLEVKNEIWLEECPYCKKKLGPKYSIWQHLQDSIQSHYDIVKQQLEMCAELFYNHWYYGQTIKGYYISNTDYWDNWYDQKTIRNRHKKLNIDYIVNHAIYDKNFTIDLDAPICPICGDNVVNKNGKHFLYTHISKKWFEEEHQKVFCKIIGDMLHCDEWDKSCYYNSNTYYHMMKTIFGKDYHVKIHHYEPKKKPLLDWEKVKKRFYYTGKIEINDICPVCHKNFSSPSSVRNHIIQTFCDEKHFDLFLRMVGDFLHNESCDSKTFFNIVNKMYQNYDYFTNSKDIVKHFIPIKQQFHYTKLEKSIHNNVCPVCQKNIIGSIWLHALQVRHIDFITQQLKMCNDLYFNNFYQGQSIKGYYLGFYSTQYCWKIWFGENTFLRNQMKNIDWKEIEQNSYYDEDFYLYYSCPICGAQYTNANQMRQHVFRNWHKEEYHELIYQIIGHILHKDFWDVSCFFNRNSYLELIEKIKGEEYVKQLQEEYNYRGVMRRGYRQDIGINVNSSWEANIYRLIQYKIGHKLNWVRGIDYEIPFDISTKTKKQTYYVDFFDKYNVFGNGLAYYEIKGQYGDDAKLKKEMFLKRYGKNYYMIGIPRKDFVPDINYLDLYNQYCDIVPCWEKFYDKSPYINNVYRSGYRNDLKIEVNSYMEANLFRIFQYEYGDWEKYVQRNIQFNFSIQNKQFIYFVSILDKGGLFNSYIEINPLFSYDTRLLIFRFKELELGKLITIGDEKFNDIQYSELENKYKKKIKNWETIK